VVSRSQLHKLGLTDAAIANATAAGRLHPVFRRVFAVGHIGIGRNGLLLAAVLACGDGTVVSHGSAAALLGLWDRSPELVDVIAPAQRGRKIDGIRRHHVPIPRPAEISIHNSIPCTNPSRTLIDLAAMGKWSLRRSIERAAVLGVLDIAAIDVGMANGRRRGSPQLRAILDDWRDARVKGRRPRLRSELEARVLALVTARELPTPLCNQMVDIDGERLEVDFLWPEHRLVVEVDGHKFHGSRVAFERDRRRDRILMLRGYGVIRVTWAQIEAEADAAISAIERLLDRRSRVL
jgi:very-short-patch-repair endonuclease